MITVRCDRCAADVEIDPEYARHLLRALGSEVSEATFAAVESSALCRPCYARWQQESERAAQREHDTWTALWLRFKARRMEYHELPQAMREAWDRVLKAELGARNQISSRRPTARELG